MGTSKTSSGPGSNVQLVPGFLVPAATPATSAGSTPASSTGASGSGGSNPTEPFPPTSQPLSADISAPSRFVTARRSINRFAKTGASSDLRSALGSYVQRGYGGGGTASRRMAKGARAAAGVFEVLRPAGGADATATDPANTVVIGFDPETLAGLSHDEVAERIADAVCPENVSLDDSGVREAVTDALSEILTENPDANILELPDFLITECYVRTLAYSTANVILADIGASIQKGAADPVVANQRYDDVRQFILERYREQSTALQDRGQRLDVRGAQHFASLVSTEVMSVFESYI